jgi:5'-3' exonuclease
MYNQLLYIVDLSVIVRNIDAAIVKVLGKNPQSDSRYHRLLTAMLIEVLCKPAHIEDLGDSLSYSMVLVKDSKPYWRSAIYPLYKKNRRAVPEQLFTRLKYSISLADKLVTQLKLGFSLAYDNFEADDIAAAYAKIWRDRQFDYRLVLYTIDTDWLGLVSDVNNIVWVDASSTYYPYVRDDAGTLEWGLKKKPPIKITTPAELFKHKQEKGDAADNLPPGCDFNLIDLITPNVNLFQHQLPLPESFKTVGDFSIILETSLKYIAKLTNESKLFKFRQLQSIS